MTRRIALPLVAALSIFALARCGGDSSPPPSASADRSGVPSDKAVHELTAQERTTLCEWSTAIQGGEGRSFSCGPFDTRIGSVADCVEGVSAVPPACPLTVSQSEDCTLANLDDPCAGTEDRRCGPALACIGL